MGNNNFLELEEGWDGSLWDEPEENFCICENCMRKVPTREVTNFPAEDGDHLICSSCLGQ